MNKLIKNKNKNHNNKIIHNNNLYLNNKFNNHNNLINNLLINSNHNNLNFQKYHQCQLYHKCHKFHNNHKVIKCHNNNLWCNNNHIRCNNIYHNKCLSKYLSKCHNIFHNKFNKCHKWIKYHKCLHILNSINNHINNMDMVMVCHTEWLFPLVLFFTSSF